MSKNDVVDFIHHKATWVFAETLKIHHLSPDTRVASSLSCIDIFATLCYGNLIKLFPNKPLHEDRDRLIISKGHGSICFYPILADLGFFSSDELGRVGQEGSFLGGIPDPIIPGYETINGSLGHGLGVACGVALSLKRRKRDQNVIVIVGDGEMNEGSNWEAMLFAAQHKLDNLLLIIDDNKISMLNHSAQILNTAQLDDKFKAFGWSADRVNGHDIQSLYSIFTQIIPSRIGKPKVVCADTIKGKGVKSLENKPLSHIMNIKPDEIKSILETLACQNR